MPEEGEESEDFKALKALMDAVPADRRAHQNREAGNKAYKLSLRLAEPKKDELPDDRMKRLAARKNKLFEALSYYSQAIPFALQADTVDDEEKNSLISILFSNRAQVHLQLENFGRVVEDCRKAIKYNPQNYKAYFRAATALKETGKHQPAFMLCRSAIALINDPSSADHTTFIKLAKEIIEAWKRLEEINAAWEAKRKAQKEAEAAEKAALDKAFSRRKLTIGPSQFRDASFNYNGKVYIDEKKALHWPVLFLYPEAQQTDYVKDVNENTKLSDILGMMFPPAAPSPEWDPTSDYRMGNIEIYVKTGEAESFIEDRIRIDSENGTKLIVDPKMNLGHALTGICNKGYVIPEFPVLCVRPVTKRG